MLLAVGLWGLAVGGWKKLLAFGCWLLAGKKVEKAKYRMSNTEYRMTKG